MEDNPIKWNEKAKKILQETTKNDLARSDFY